MILTKNELEIMDLLWGEKRPLTGAEIKDLSDKTKTWKDSSLHILINSLLKKNAIYEYGFVKTGKGYGRTFYPTKSGEEYYTNYLISISKKSNITKVFAALFNEDDVSEETIQELESLLKQYKAKKSR